MTLNPWNCLSETALVQGMPDEHDTIDLVKPAEPAVPIEDAQSFHL